MKEIIKSVKENIDLRVKNPIVGALFISWVTVNIKDIAIIFFMSNDERIKFIKSMTFDLESNILLPSAIAAFYLIALPYLHLLYDRITLSFNLKRNNIKFESAMAEAKNKEKLGIQKAKYQPERINKLIELNLVDWENEREKLIEDLKSQEKIILSNRDELKKINRELGKRQNEINEDRHVIKVQLAEIDSVINKCIEKNEISKKIADDLLRKIEPIRFQFNEFNQIPF